MSQWPLYHLFIVLFIAQRNAHEKMLKVPGRFKWFRRLKGSYEEEEVPTTFYYRVLF